MKRLASNGWTVHITTTVLNEARKWPAAHKDMFTRSTALGRFNKAFGKGWLERKYVSALALEDRIVDYSTSYFTVSGDTTIKKDVSLSSLIRNVKQFPIGSEAGVLTAAIEHVRLHPQDDCLLSKLGDLANQQGFVVPDYDEDMDKASVEKWSKVAAQYPSKHWGDMPIKKEEPNVKAEGKAEEELDAHADAEADEDGTVGRMDGGSAEIDKELVEDGNLEGNADFEAGDFEGFRDLGFSMFNAPF